MKSAKELKAVADEAAKKLQDQVDDELYTMIEVAAKSGKHIFKKEYPKYHDGEFYPSATLMRKLEGMGYKVSRDITQVICTVEIKW